MRHLRTLALLAICLLCSSACVLPVRWIGSTRSIDAVATPTLKPKYDGWSDRDQGLLSGAVSETLEVVGSESFKQRVSQIEFLKVSAFGSYMSGVDVIGVYGSVDACVRYLPSSASHQTASTDFDARDPRDDCRRTTRAKMELGLDYLRRNWVAGDSTPAVVARSCLVNTLAHEWSHIAVDTGGRLVFTDGCHLTSQSPIVSYTIGAVAQCTYLERKGRIRADQVPSCVEHVGTRSFAGDACGAGWLGRLR